MAWTTKRPNGTQWVGFRHEGKSYTIRLGHVAEKDATAFADNVQTLLDYVSRRLVVPPVLADWADRLPDRHAKPLRSAGVLRGNPLPRTVGQLVAAELALSATKAERTQLAYRAFGASLIEFFGADRPVASVAPEDGRRFADWLAARYAPTTVGAKLRFAQRLFGRLAAEGVLRKNPFNARGTVLHDDARDRYVDPVEVDQLLRAIADPEFAAVVVLSRYAGLRVPSELAIRWADVGDTSFRVFGQKTKRWRTVPLFPPIAQRLALLPRTADVCLPGVVARGASFCGDRLATAYRDAGIAGPPPKPWINFRASAERDLLVSYPIDDVASWLGHSPSTALRSYSRAAAWLATSSAVARGPGNGSPSS